MEDAKLIDGKKWARKLEEELKIELIKLSRKPKIVSILVGDDPASVLYSQIKQKKAKEVGVLFEWISFPEDADLVEVAMEIENLNQDNGVDGIMVQLPLPQRFLEGHDESEIIGSIDPEKDVDGLTGNSDFLPAAVVAVLKLLQDEDIKLTNKKIVILGKSNLVGKPLAQQLISQGLDVEVCDSKTQDLDKQTKAADVLISATGVAELVKGEMVKEGAVVIDVGSEKINGKVVGDVQFASVYPQASKITPVPGGVGPMTVMCLMENVIKVCETKLT
ncbi:MAG: bifunctional 5,10-methylenetetrahydrofolate dehydrogenase/5,10-methenyltetrahydrofolate cyclohydrolase [Patescibacteria group bacterium]|nr:bifunctional 5,10-methylenetetrahydrofolate dehydrogenase/5,10-methenyltetrahydrofolate cyclohydrolase [Patescibacteria group bacterium]